MISDAVYGCEKLAYAAFEFWKRSGRLPVGYCRKFRLKDFVEVVS